MGCISCSKETSQGVRLPCAKCSEEIMRCDKCRGLSIKYSCPKCQHEGP